MFGSNDEGCLNFQLIYLLCKNWLGSNAFLEKKTNKTRKYTRWHSMFVYTWILKLPSLINKWMFGFFFVSVMRLSAEYFDDFHSSQLKNSAMLKEKHPWNFFQGRMSVRILGTNWLKTGPIFSNILSRKKLRSNPF